MAEKLTQEQWDDLDSEAQALRQDEKPEEKVETPTVEELAKTVEELTGRLTTAEDEKKGVYGDLKAERTLRQQLEATTAELKRSLESKGDDPLAGKPDDEYITVAEVKKIIAHSTEAATKSQRADNIAEAKERSTANYNADEERMSVRKDLKVPYAEVIKEFQKMASSNPALWEAVQRESIRRGGKPAEVAYKLGLTSDVFIGKIEANARETLIKGLEKEGKIKPKKLPSGGSGKVNLDPALMSEEDLLNLPEAELDKLLKETG